MISLLNDHKVGTQLTYKIVEILNSSLGVSSRIIINTFYLFHQTYNEEDKYITVIRHPKEIIISGYLYHKICNEEWAVRVGGDYYTLLKRLNFPNKALMLEKHKDYINQAAQFSQPKSYQKKLNELSQEAGIIYEMNSLSKLTIDGMYNLPQYGKPNNFILKFEDLVFNHDKVIEDLCIFLNIDKEKIENIVTRCKSHNLLSGGNPLFHGKITSTVEQSVHITNKKLQKNRYKEFWSDNIEKEFIRLFPNDILSKFGYI